MPDRGWSNPSSIDAWILAGAVATWLILPKLVVLVRNALSGVNRNFGGTLRVSVSVLAEIMLSTALAPILLCFQSRAVLQILLGLDGGWPATDRASSRLSLEEAFAASWWMMAAASLAVAVVVVLAPATLPWLMPVAVPAVLAPVLISLSSRRSRSLRLFAAPVELSVPDIIRDQRRLLAKWSAVSIGPDSSAVAPRLGGSAHA